MADAEVIPIGGRGRPGRGSRTSPSAAARALAPSPSRSGRAAKVESPETAQTDGPVHEQAAPSAAPAPRKRATSTSARTKKAPSRSPSNAPRAEAPPHPSAEAGEARTAYSADDIADAVAGAAREVFGTDGWQQQLAQTLAFIRRRITGAYEVDE